MTTVPATTHNRPTRVPAVWLGLAGVAALAVAVSAFVAPIDKEAVTPAGGTSTNMSAQIARDVNQLSNHIAQHSATTTAEREFLPRGDQTAASQIARDLSQLGHYFEQYSARINAHVPARTGSVEPDGVARSDRS